MPDVGEDTLVRGLIPPPRQPKQIPARREQRHPPAQPPQIPGPATGDTDDRPHIDEYA